MVNKQYGLSKGTNKAMFITEAYQTLRDRGPYPADQVLKELQDSLGFMIYDNFCNICKSLISWSKLGNMCGLAIYKWCVVWQCINGVINLSGTDY